MIKADTNLIYSKTNLKWLKDNTIYLTLHGSHAYGTNRPDSDIDIRGIAIPPKEYFFGILDNFEQAQFSDPYDCVIFNLHKFIKLCLDCNPNAVELLFTEPEDHLLDTPIFNKFIEIRDCFLSKKARFTFAGYAHSQIQRIKRHRKWILYPLTKKPERADFNLPDNKKLIPSHKLEELEAQVQKKLNEWSFDSTGLDSALSIDIRNRLSDILTDIQVNQDDLYIYAARSLGIDDNLLEAFKRERLYAVALKEWNAYIIWKKERNRDRFVLEEKYGYDSKNALHLYRLYKQCFEVLEHGKLVVKRPDVEELNAVKSGKFTYDELIEWSEKQEIKLDKLYKTSTLKKEPDRKKINDTLIEVISEFIGK